MTEGHYITAQICINGHVVSDSAGEYAELRASFCSKCGKPTIMNCPKCKAAIRGHYRVRGFVSLRADYTPPSFCHACGEPYPWTAAKLQAARDLADEVEGLTLEEKQVFKDALPDLVADTPRTQVAAARAMKFLTKAGATIAGALREIIVDVGSEAAKKIILGK